MNDHPILEAGKPEEAPKWNPKHPLTCNCGYCGKVMRRRSTQNEPAYCDYVCACNGQPEKTRRSLHNTTGGNVN